MMKLIDFLTFDADANAAIADSVRQYQTHALDYLHVSLAIDLQRLLAFDGSADLST